MVSEKRLEAAENRIKELENEVESLIDNVDRLIALVNVLVIRGVTDRNQITDLTERFEEMS